LEHLYSPPSCLCPGESHHVESSMHASLARRTHVCSPVCGRFNNRPVPVRQGVPREPPFVVRPGSDVRGRLLGLCLAVRPRVRHRRPVPGDGLRRNHESGRSRHRSYQGPVHSGADCGGRAPRSVRGASGRLSESETRFASGTPAPARSSCDCADTRA